MEKIETYIPNSPSSSPPHTRPTCRSSGGRARWPGWSRGGRPGLRRLCNVMVTNMMSIFSSLSLNLLRRLCYAMLYCIGCVRAYSKEGKVGEGKGVRNENENRSQQGQARSKKHERRGPPICHRHRHPILSHPYKLTQNEMKTASNF